MPRLKKSIVDSRSTIVKKAFTLIELIVVISIIGILATIGTATYSTAQQKARDTQRKQNLKSIRDSLILYLRDESHYPPITVLDSKFPSNSDAWIPNLVPDYQPKLPTDPTQSPGILACDVPGNYYCYEVRNNNLEFTLWAKLENTKDPELNTNLNAACQETLTNFNYCLKSPAL